MQILTKNIQISLVIGLFCLILEVFLFFLNVIPPIPKLFAATALLRVVYAAFVVTVMIIIFGIAAGCTNSTLSAVLTVTACAVPLILVPVLDKVVVDLKNAFVKNVQLRTADLSLFLEQGDAQLEVLSALLALRKSPGFAGFLSGLGDVPELHKQLSSGRTTLIVERLSAIVRAPVTSEDDDKFARARAARALGILLSPTDLEGAIDAYKSAVDIDPADNVSWYWLGRSELHYGRSREAAVAFSNIEANAIDVGDEETRARSLEGLGRVAVYTGDYRLAQRRFQAVIEILKKRQERGSCESKCKSQISLVLLQRGQVEMLSGLSSEAEASILASCRLREELLAAQPTSIPAQHAVGTCNSTLAGLYKQLEKWDQTEKYYISALEYIRRVVESDPAFLPWRDSLFVVFDGLGRVLVRKASQEDGYLREAEGLVVAGFCTARYLNARAPGNMRFLYHLGYGYMGLLNVSLVKWERTNEGSLERQASSEGMSIFSRKFVETYDRIRIGNAPAHVLRDMNPLKDWIEELGLRERHTTKELNESVTCASAGM